MSNPVSDPHAYFEQLRARAAKQDRRVVLVLIPADTVDDEVLQITMLEPDVSLAEEMDRISDILDVRVPA